MMNKMTHCFAFLKKIITTIYSAIPQFRQKEMPQYEGFDADAFETDVLKFEISSYRKTLEENEKTLGKEHLDTLATMCGLAGFLSNKGDMESRGEAEALYRENLRFYKEALGDERTEMLVTMCDLAGLLSDKSDMESRDEARKLYEEALNEAEEKLGEKHPLTQKIKKKLAQLGDESEE